MDVNKGTMLCMPTSISSDAIHKEDTQQSQA
jgi:hypothetical protein